MTDSGLQLEIELMNQGTTSISASVDVTYKGDKLHLTNPDIVLSSGRGPVTVSYSLPPRADLRSSSRLQVALVDESGHTLAVSSTGIKIGTILAAVGGMTMAGLISLAIAAPSDPNPPAPTVSTTEIEAEDGDEAPIEFEHGKLVAVDFAPVSSLVAAPADDPRLYPLGRHDAAVVELGNPEFLGKDQADRFYNSSGGSVTKQTVTAYYGEQAYDLGTVMLPRDVPLEFVEFNVDQEPVVVAEVALDDVEIMTGDPLPAVCFNTQTDDPLGGYRATGPGVLIAQFTLAIDSDGQLIGSVHLLWEGAGRLEFFPDFDPTELTDNNCDETFTAGARWD